MLAILLAIHFFLVFGLFSHSTPTLSLREKFIGGSLIWSVHLVLLTELLSTCDAITFNVLAGYWIATVLVLGLVWHRLKVSLPAHIHTRTREAWQATTVFEKGLLGFIGLLLAGLAIIALVAPPNTWDSMTYHLARVMHWIQNKSVDHYPSHIMRQHYLPPFAEYVLLHLQILNGTDRLANLVQFGSLIGSLVGVSLITKLLGGGRKAQILSMFLTATIPMAVLQGTSTQNDLVASFWVVSSVYFLIKFLLRPHIWRTCIGVGLAVGLATFTKATTYLWLFPFCTAALIYLLVRYKNLLHATRLAVVISVSILCLNAQHFFRNYAVYGHVLGGTPEERAMYVNASHTPAGMASNSIRNAVLHLRTPFYYWNRAVRLSVLRVHEWMGITIHDPEITFYSSGNLPFHENWQAMSEDTTGNLFHFLLFACSLFVLFSKADHVRYRRVILYASLCGAGFLFFCLYLRWQEWHSRLHLPLFMLMTPVAAWVLSERYKKRLFIPTVILSLTALCALFFNVNKPIRHIPESIFGSILTENREELYTNKISVYSDAVRYIAARDTSTKIGLRLGSDDGEYLYWVFAPKRLTPVQFHHVHVKDPSGSLATAYHESNYLLTSLDSASTIRLGSFIYRKDTSFGFCHIYHKEPN